MSTVNLSGINLFKIEDKIYNNEQLGAFSVLPIEVITRIFDELNPGLMNLNGKLYQWNCEWPEKIKKIVFDNNHSKETKENFIKENFTLEEIQDLTKKFSKPVVISDIEYLPLVSQTYKFALCCKTFCNASQSTRGLLKENLNEMIKTQLDRIQSEIKLKEQAKEAAFNLLQQITLHSEMLFSMPTRDFKNMFNTQFENLKESLAEYPSPEVSEKLNLISQRLELSEETIRVREQEDELLLKSIQQSINNSYEQVKRSFEIYKNTPTQDLETKLINLIQKMKDIFLECPNSEIFSRNSEINSQMDKILEDIKKIEKVPEPQGSCTLL